MDIPERISGSFCLRGTDCDDDLWSDSGHVGEDARGQVRQQRRNATRGQPGLNRRLGDSRRNKFRQLVRQDRDEDGHRDRRAAGADRAQCSERRADVFRRQGQRHESQRARLDDADGEAGHEHEGDPLGLVAGVDGDHGRGEREQRHTPADQDPARPLDVLAHRAADHLADERGAADDAGEPAAMRGGAAEEVCDLLGPDDVHGVVDAGADHGGDDHGEVAAGFEEVDGEQRVAAVHVDVIEDEDDKCDEADDDGRDDVRAVPGINRAAPAKTGQIYLLVKLLLNGA